MTQARTRNTHCIYNPALAQNNNAVQPDPVLAPTDIATLAPADLASNNNAPAPNPFSLPNINESDLENIDTMDALSQKQ